MSTAFSKEWLNRYCKRMGQHMPKTHTNSSHELSSEEDMPRRSKHGNRCAEFDGEVYDSKQVEVKMSGEFTEEWLKDYCQRMGQPMPKMHTNPSHDKELVEDTPRRSKYGNRRTEFDGDVYDSKHEAEIAKVLMYRGGCGEFKSVARQVPFFLPGGVKYIADFVVFLQDGSYQVLDAKSEATKQNAVYRMKKRQMRQCLGIEILEV